MNNKFKIKTSDEAFILDIHEFVGGENETNLEKKTIF